SCGHSRAPFRIYETASQRTHNEWRHNGGLTGIRFPSRLTVVRFAFSWSGQKPRSSTPLQKILVLDFFFRFLFRPPTRIFIPLLLGLPIASWSEVEVPISIGIPASSLLTAIG